MQKPKFAVVGAGIFGQLHARVFSEHPAIELALVCDVREERAQAVAEANAAGGWCRDYREVMAREEIAAVSVATPDFAHTEIALAAARAGKHVLIEKPMATKVEECQQMMEAAKAAGVKLMVDFHNRWNPPFYKARETIESGEIGEPRFIYCRLSDTIYVPTRMLSWAGRTSVLWFLGSHVVDAVCWLLGERPGRVFGLSRSGVLEGMGITTPDVFVYTLEFPSGALVAIENCWILPETTPNIVDFKCEIIGSRGALYIDFSHARLLERYTETTATYPDLLVAPMFYGQQAGFAAESLRHFVECVLEDKPPLVRGEDGLEVTRVLCGVEESIKTGQAVEIKQ